MKRILYLVAIFSFLFTGAFAQSLSLSNYNITVWGNQWDEMGGSLTFMNTSSNSIDVMCERVNNDLAPGHSSYFCFNGECFDDNTSLSTVVHNLAAGASASGSFIHYCKPQGNLGHSNVSYCFYDNNNSADSVCITFSYSASAVGINEQNKDAFLSYPQPNPSDNYTTFSYSVQENPLDYSLVVYNILGTKVAEQQLTDNQGLIVLSTRDLNAGNYFYSLIYKDQVVSTSKLLVSHR
ncbi:MAG: T9SS type A sorting domain-containing protein [Bacteroidia bacterium]|nr:T9SS type A sorting domain-containing protein [Bacteroidia bacterium]